ncbi:hypothetical protein D1872_285180 [compost metagenome]
MDSGVTMEAAASCVIPAPAATAGLLLAFMLDESSFINSYCIVLSSCREEVNRKASNQEFQAPTATNKAIVASTGLHSGKMIRQKILKSPAPSILADSTRLSGIVPI